MTIVEQDYIKNIYELSIDSKQSIKKNEYITNNQLTTLLGSTVQTVNEMVKKLAKKGFIDYQPYKGSQLTQSGISEAVRLVRIHRIWEEFLVNKLGYTWKEVHEDAEKLEHVTSPLLEERLYEFLDRPKYCPHGGPIPDLSGNIEEAHTIPLNECEAGKSYSLSCVRDDSKLLHYLDTIHLKLNSPFKVISIDTLNKNIVIEISNTQLFIGFDVAKSLYVKVIS